MITGILNVFVALYQRLILWGEALFSLVYLIGGGIGALFSGGPAAFFLKAGTQRRAFALLRGLWPNIALKRVVMKCYDNTGTAIVTRRDDVIDVLNRNDDFEVVYGTRMRELTQGNNFFLGMQPGWEYTRDTSSMRMAGRMSDVAEIQNLRQKVVA